MDEKQCVQVDVDLSSCQRSCSSTSRATRGVHVHLLFDELLRQNIPKSEAGHGRKRLRQDRLRVQQANVGRPENCKHVARLLLAIIA